jgi:perosamine synthetase
MEKGQKMLLPEYICEVVIHPLENLGIKPVYYPVDDHFVPDWDTIEDIQTQEKVDAFLLIHYFGQPQDIEQAIIFCDKHDIRFIEDNAHGHGGTFNGQPLGSFGDMGFSSPRKQLSTASGGMLYLDGKPVHPNKEELQTYPVSNSKEMLRNLSRNFPRLKAGLRSLLRHEPDFADPSSFPEIRMGYFKADKDSERMIISKNWSEYAAVRRENWCELSSYATENGLCPVWAKPHPESCPWVMPVYANSPEERMKWLHWGWNTGINLFPWPTLPEAVLQKSLTSINRWQHLFCLPL